VYLPSSKLYCRWIGE